MSVEVSEESESERLCFGVTLDCRAESDSKRLKVGESDDDEDSEGDGGEVEIDDSAKVNLEDGREINKDDKGEEKGDGRDKGDDEEELDMSDSKCRLRAVAK